MARHQDNDAAKVILTLFGLTAVSLFLGLHKFLWRLWVVLSGLWVLMIVMLGREDPGFFEQSNAWFVMFLPPLILLGIVLILAWIIDGMRG